MYLQILLYEAWIGKLLFIFTDSLTDCHSQIGYTEFSEVQRKLISTMNGSSFYAFPWVAMEAPIYVRIFMEDGLKTPYSYSPISRAKWGHTPKYKSSAASVGLDLITQLYEGSQKWGCGDGGRLRHI